MQGNNTQRDVFAGTADHAGADDDHDVFNAGFFLNQRIDFIGKFLSAVAGCTFGQLNVHKDNALVFGRNERRLADVQKTADPGEQHQHQQKNDADFAAEETDDRSITVTGTVDNSVEPEQRTALCRFERMQQRSAQRRRQRQGVKRREGDRRRNGNCELLVNLSGNAAEETDRHENRQQNQSRGDNGAGNLFHGLDSGFFRREFFAFHQKQNAFNHHNRVVHDQTDGQHQTEQGHHVQAVAQSQHNGKGGKNGYRNGQRRNQRRAPILQEDVTDEDNQSKGQNQREDDFFNGSLNISGRIVADRINDVVRKTLGQTFDFGFNAGHGVQSVGAGKLVDGDGDVRRTVVFGCCMIVFFADFNTGNVLQVDQTALFRRTDNDVFEVFHFVDAALRLQRVDHLLGAVARHGADAAQRRLVVLSFNGRFY